MSGATAHPATSPAADLGADPAASLPVDPLYDRVAQRSARAVIAGYSTSFGWACRLLSEPVRTHVRDVYALVRVADELVDGPVAADRTRARVQLDALEEQTLEAVATGHSTNLVVHAFALTARACGIDADLVVPFFASMRTDLSVTSHDEASLRQYVYGSAEVVGLMCLRVFVAAPDADGRRTYEDLAPGARRLGAAFQKVNFLRDLGADRDLRGRTYVPGVGNRVDAARRDALLDDIDADLAAAADVIPQLPPSSRRAVRAAHDLFAALTRRLRAVPADRLDRTRVRVPTPGKAWLLARAYVAGGRS